MSPVDVLRGADPVLCSSLADADPEVFAAIAAELARQQSTLEMIASENFAPLAVMQAQGSVLTNKYAEGYPGRRYYGGCEHVDVIEQLAIDRVKALFGAEYANVQPHSGAQANAAAMAALLRARRHDPRARPRARRPPHPRHAAQLLRQAVPTSSPTTSARRTTWSTWTRSRGWPTSTARR